MDVKSSFTDLFNIELDLDKENKVKINQIVIPKIQRPYAQGRLDDVSTYVRNTLLNELFESFEKDEPFDLNFIYGIIRKSNKDYVMELLDGQQRITTLFLLYWYMANRELDDNDPENEKIRQSLKSFTYETRSTSSIFCKNLADRKINLNEKKPSEIIKNAKWYYKSFDKDSTICAMLVMLDAIHAQYNNQKNHSLYKKLQNIHFYVKSLGFFNLSEELYIKMNARGLQLSPFDNFKADLTNLISNSDYSPYKEMVPLYQKDSSDSVQFHVNFAIKLDAKWIDLFWKNGKDFFDAVYMSFFTRFFTCKRILSTKDSVTDREIRQDPVVRKLFTDAENKNVTDEYLGFQPFNEVLKNHPEYILTLDKVLDWFYEYDYKDESKRISRLMAYPWSEKTEEDVFDKNKITLSKLTVFGAVIEFIESYTTFDVEILKKWMRVVWNVVENTDVDNISAVSSLIRKFSDIIHFVAKESENGKEFYQAISQWPVDKNELKGLVEEIEKARRIAEDVSWLTAFCEAEKHPFFKGMVLFFYDEKMSLNQYKHNYSLAKNIFDENGITCKYREKHLLIRAIVAQYSSWNEINNKYITERAETNKHLKNILSSQENVKKMFVSVLKNDDDDSVLIALDDFVTNAKKTIVDDSSNLEQKYYAMAENRIRNDIRLYDWIAKIEDSKNVTFRIYSYEGHIMYAVPKKQYDKVALDTERAKIAADVADKYHLNYCDNNQKTMYDEFEDSFGNEIWLENKRKNCQIRVGFRQNHILQIQILCESKLYATQVKQDFDNSSFVDGNELCVNVENLVHFRHKETLEALSRALDNVFSKIPQE